MHGIISIHRYIHWWLIIFPCKDVNTVVLKAVSCTVTGHKTANPWSQQKSVVCNTQWNCTVTCRDIKVSVLNFDKIVDTFMCQNSMINKNVFEDTNSRIAETNLDFKLIDLILSADGLTLSGTSFTGSDSQIAKFMGPTWGPPGSCRPQMGPMLAPWTLLSGLLAKPGSNQHYLSIGSSNGLATSRRQAIVWTNDGIVYWLICALFGLDKLTHVTLMTHIWVSGVGHPPGSWGCFTTLGKLNTFS